MPECTDGLGDGFFWAAHTYTLHTFLDDNAELFWCQKIGSSLVEEGEDSLCTGLWAQAAGNRSSIAILKVDSIDIEHGIATLLNVH